MKVFLFLVMLIVLTHSFTQPEESKRSHEDQSKSKSSRSSSSSHSSYHKTGEHTSRARSTHGGKHTHKRKHTTTEESTSKGASKYEEKYKRRRTDSSDEEPSTSKGISHQKTSESVPHQIPFPPFKYLLPTTITALENHQKCKKYVNRQRTLEFMLFVQYWPGEHCANDYCTIPKTKDRAKEKFFLHGYWPEIVVNQNMFCCVNQFTFDDVEKRLLDDKKLMRKIHKNWISVSKCKVAMHQFDKHGTCALSTYRGRDGPFDYMKTAIRLYKNMNIWKFLQRSELKVETNKLYDIEEIRSVVRKAYGGKPAFMCRNGNSVYEVRVCYDPSSDRFNPKPIRCPLKIEKVEKKFCDKKVMFKTFPGYLLDPKIAPRNDCLY
ncbi:ribonuclease 3 precursor, putative [Entamoeba invadens IP1]|uniref:Ribonuclease 3, putative n=1 Tax=Entamoeba invadens IP1 TaxID=370355 RepID=L7FME1_ENTIV|nr:ribonuclease 3 precursor, putative [Entamoeba invadens IP1]ELP90973.1 ribonuclease 3 precursor, putative [Entamoeba invadens IP1]|eukprot:XP_004257744.1 ribonuclease 3 precursor, putative [Entamoeba invadens IP1]